MSNPIEIHREDSREEQAVVDLHFMQLSFHRVEGRSKLANFGREFGKDVNGRAMKRQTSLDFIDAQNSLLFDSVVQS